MAEIINEISNNTKTMSAIFDTPNIEISNHSTNYSYLDYEYDYTDQEEHFYFVLWSIVTPILFGIIFLLGTGGNSLVIYVIVAKPALRTVTNLLLLNLAVADIAFLLVCVPFTAYKYAALTWPFGDVICKVFKYFLYVSCYVTIYTLVAISVLRYMTIVWNATTKAWRTKRNITFVIILIWVVVLSVNAPVLLIHQVNSYKGYVYCGMELSAVGALFVSFFIFSYVLPLFAICILYLLIVWFIHRSKKLSTIQQDRGKDRTTHVAKVIFTVVLVFGISWLPLHINSLVAKYGKLPSGSWYEVFRVLFNCLAYGNSCANPFIYNYVSAEFKKAFKETICCQKRGKQRPWTELSGMANGDTA